MTHRAYPYTPFDAQAQDDTGVSTLRNPPRKTGRHYGDNAYDGLETQGAKGVVVPLHHPGDSGRDSVRGGSNVVTGGTVKGYITHNDTIRPSLLVARNLFSPSSHPSDAARLAASGREPARAIIPSKDIKMPPKMGKRGTGGHYTIPAPMVTPNFATSADYLRLRGRFFG